MPTLTNLDLDTLRTFAVAHDLGSLARAADRLGRTPSAISLQMKRLQDELGSPVFRKRGRGLVLTEAGEVALSYARRILTLNDELLHTMHGARLTGQMRLGCSQDFATVLPGVLSQFSEMYPRMQMELRIEGNAVLADAVEQGQIDVAVVIGHEQRAAAQTVGELEIVWIASAKFLPARGEPLPIAALGPQCVFRRGAVARLEESQTPYRLAASSPSLDGLWAALLGGLGVTARTALNLPAGLVSARSLHNLPALGRLPVTLHRGAHATGAATARMAALLEEALRDLLGPPSRVQRRVRNAPGDKAGVAAMKRQPRSPLP